MEKRPWGYFEILSDSPAHKIKRITVHPESRLSLQSHQFRSEHWYVLEGLGLVTLNGADIPAEKGESFDIPRHAKHRVRNTGKTNLIFVEIQTGDYFGEDDIERTEDDYGRI